MQKLSNYNDSRNESCQDSSFSEVHLTILIVSTFSLFHYLIILSIFHRLKRDLYEHFFWKLAVLLA